MQKHKLCSGKYLRLLTFTFIHINLANNCNILTMTSTITYIPNKSIHDTIVAESATTPTVIYLCNSVLPFCKTFTPKYEALAQKWSSGEKDSSGSEVSNVRFTQMENTPETSPMFKFAPNQLPVVIFISEGKWAKTLMSPTIEEVERGLEELVERVGKWRN